MTSPEEIASALRPGTIVGEYQITHILGEGGMGIVYAGTHPEIGKRVAIKVLAPHAAQYPDLIRRFKEEARAVNKIHHPNIIDIFAFNQLPDGRHYFVMEYLDGESLTARLQRGSMDLGEMRRLLAQICGALEAAHEAGVVHRDFKPDNIWIARQHLSESRIKLIDFGIAKLNDLTNTKVTQTGVSMGTPHYMAPEQAMGRPVDRRADIYALGVVLYQIFAGRLPFEGVTTHEIAFKHASETPARPSSHRPIVPTEMEQIILDCLEKVPERRPPSMAVLSRRIEAAFASQNGPQAGAGSATAIPHLPDVASSRAPVRTAVFPESGHTPGMVPAPLPSTTTLRGSTGERVGMEGDLKAAGPAATGGHGWRKLAVGILVVALVAIAVVGFGIRGRRPSEASLPISEPRPIAAGSSPSPAAAPATTSLERAVPVEPPPALVHAEAPAAAKAEAAPATPPVPARSEHRHKSPAKPAAPMVGNAKAPEPQQAAELKAVAPRPAVTKPNCTPNFYLDVQGDKHFKPECF